MSCMHVEYVWNYIWVVGVCVYDEFVFFFFFFFQAEDGIRDWSVTGVQTCALPICSQKNFQSKISTKSFLRAFISD